MSRIPFWRIIVFGRHGIVLSGQAEPRQIMLNRNSVKLNSTFLRIQEEPPPKRRLVFVQQSSKSYGYFSKRPEISLMFCARALFSSVLRKRSGLKQGAHIETGGVVHRYAVFQSVFHRICRAAGSPCAIGDTISRVID